MTAKAPMPDERWLPVQGRLGYEVSSEGRIRWRQRVRKPTPDSNGYLRVSFWQDGKAVKVAVHIIVAEAFLGPRPLGMVVRHGDGDKANCRASNLVWGTSAENEEDKDAHGTKVQGTAHHSNKLAEADVRSIRARYVPRDPVNGLAALGREFGVSTKTVEAIVKRIIWKHLS